MPQYKTRLIRRKKGSPKERPRVCFIDCEHNLFQKISRCQIAMKNNGFIESAIEEFVVEAMEYALLGENNKLTALINSLFVIEKRQVKKPVKIR